MGGVQDHGLGWGTLWWVVLVTQKLFFDGVNFNSQPTCMPVNKLILKVC